MFSLPAADRRRGAAGAGSDGESGGHGDIRGHFVRWFFESFKESQGFGPPGIHPILSGPGNSDLGRGRGAVCAKSRRIHRDGIIIIGTCHTQRGAMSCLRSSETSTVPQCDRTSSVVGLVPDQAPGSPPARDRSSQAIVDQQSNHSQLHRNSRLVLTVAASSGVADHPCL